MYVKATDPQIANILRRCGYHGKKDCQLKPFPVGGKNIDSYWDGGSRDYWYFYNLATNEVIEVHSNHPFFEPNQPNFVSKLPENVLLVCRPIFRGEEIGCYIYSNDFAPLLPAAPLVPLNDEQFCYLFYTKAYKSGPYRQEAIRRHCKTPNATLAELQRVGYIAKNKAITTEGKNYLAANESRKRELNLW